MAQRALARHNLTWEKFFVRVGVHWAPIVGHIQEREVKQSSSSSIGGRGEELEEGGDDQEEELGGAAAKTNPIEEMVGAIVVIEEDIPLASVVATTET